eukprot:PITA_00811
MEMRVKAAAIMILLPFIPYCIPCGESGPRGRSLVYRSPALGVDYGQTADNLPPPSAVAKLVQRTTISKVKLYGADPAILQAFANTGIGLVVGIGNDQIPSLNQLTVAQNWIKNNIVPFVPATDIIGISVGNEVLFNGDRALISQLLPAMQNLHIALAGVSLDKQIKVSTPHSMAILSTSVPPSAGRFNESFDMKSILDFLEKIGAPLMINSYPFFAYKSNPTDQTLAYALFKPNPGFYDSNTGLTYSNMFDAQLDAVYSAMKYLGYPGIDIVVAETGWPSAGDPTEAGVSLQNAITYNGNLIKHVTSMVGTPLRPNRYIKTYIFALFNEDLKPGPSSERNYGLFKPDMTMSYDVGLLQSRSAGPSPSPPRTGGPVTAPPTRTEGPVTAPPTRTGPVTAPPTRTEGPVTAPPMGKVWCITKPGADEKTLQANLNYACGQGIDCGPIQPGGPCYSPNTVACHAAYAMNAYYQAKGRNSWNCDFAQTGAITTTDPSYGSCMYPAA